MKKKIRNITILIALTSLLNGCIESMALLGPATSGAGSSRIAQSSISSVLSIGIKKQTGKTPSGHALAYVKKHNPENKKENCVGIKSTNSKACAIANKKVELAKLKIKETLTDKAINFKSQFAKARKAGKDYFVYNNKIYNTSFKEPNNSKKVDKVKNNILVKSKIEDLAKKSNIIQR